MKFGYKKTGDLGGYFIHVTFFFCSATTHLLKVSRLINNYTSTANKILMVHIHTNAFYHSSTHAHILI